ncbi:MAG: phosphatase PAP2 family protein, partial [Mycobacteriaceae bacterium]
PALVGLSLVLRDYHWLSDVLAGWLLGSLLLIATPALATWLMGMQRSGSDAAISRGQVGAESPPWRKVLG